MTDLRHENFDKLSRQVKEAEESCARTYGIWLADTERLKRLQALRNDAWMELLAGAIHPATV